MDHPSSSEKSEKISLGCGGNIWSYPIFLTRSKMCNFHYVTKMSAVNWRKVFFLVFIRWCLLLIAWKTISSISHEKFLLLMWFPCVIAFNLIAKTQMKSVCQACHELCVEEGIQNTSTFIKFTIDIRHRNLITASENRRIWNADRMSFYCILLLQLMLCYWNGNWYFQH